MGADSKQFQRGSFRVPVGACIGVSNVQQFSDDYDRFFDQSFKKFGVTKAKTVFNSSEISTLYSGNIGGFIDFLESFIKEVCAKPNVVVNVAYSAINSKQLDNQRVKYYGDNRSAVRPVDFMKFIEHLTQYYAYITAWSVSKLAGIHGTTIHVDGFDGENTEAWRELKNSHVIQVYPNGDKCNKLISAADLIVKYLDEKMWLLRSRIEQQSFNNILQSLGIVNPKVFYVSNAALKSIVPVEPRPIYLKPFYKRPMLFILTEGTMLGEKEYLENKSESMSAIHRCAIAHETGYKFIDYGKDHQLLQDKDIVVYLGPRGKENCELLRTMGYSLKVMSLEQLKIASKSSTIDPS
jgi:hypothetical protein